ncbi:MAG: AcrR family transcriptional regulator [Candidatus Azotimanducaceae bacterium]|jgi:AcrR family transcriptional regulator
MADHKAKDLACPSRSYHHGDLRQVLMDAAFEHLKTKSTYELSLRGLARDIGVSQTAPYRHFESKGALFVALAIFGFKLLRDEVGAAREEAGSDPENVLIQQGLAYINWAEKNPEKYQLFFDSNVGGYPPDAELHRVGAESFQDVLDTIEAGIAAEIFLDKPVIELGAIVWSFVHGTASLLIGKGALMSEPDQEGLIFNGISSVAKNRELNLKLLVQALKK